MTMQRIRRQKDSSFTTIDNTAIRAANLSLKAKGVLLTVMGLPESWDFSVAGLIAIVKEGKSAVYAAIKELRDAGYVDIERQYENGKIVSWNYVFRERPNLLTDFQEVENLEVENLDIENRTQLKKQLIKETTNQRNTSFVNAAAFENTNAYPIFDLVDAFPDVMFTPGQCDQIANIVKDTPTDRAAWSATIEKYKLDYNPELKRYIPNKVGNLLGVFLSEKSRIERANNGTNNSNSAYRKRSDAEVFAESADFYANYPAEHTA